VENYRIGAELCTRTSSDKTAERVIKNRFTGGPNPVSEACTNKPSLPQTDEPYHAWMMFILAKLSRLASSILISFEGKTNTELPSSCSMCMTVQDRRSQNSMPRELLLSVTKSNAISQIPTSF